MLMRLEEHTLNAGKVSCRALVVSPTQGIVLDRARLEELRGTTAGSDFDREIVANVRAHQGESCVVVISARGKTQDEFWRFDPSLSAEEAAELGYLLVEDELPTYRRLVAAGVFSMVHVNWGVRETLAYQQGTKRLLKELRAAAMAQSETTGPSAMVAAADRFILANLTSFHNESLEAVVQNSLGAKLPDLLESEPHFRAVVRAIPKSILR